MASLNDFTLLPSDDVVLTADEMLAAAVASRLDTAPETTETEAPTPFGRTPLFDWDTGQMVTRGGTATGGTFPGEDMFPGADTFTEMSTVIAAGSVVMATEDDALKQWVMMVIHSARFAHRVFTDEFGMEIPDSVLGEAADIDEAVSDWGVRLQEALQVHDRIATAEDFKADYNPDSGLVTIHHISVVTDQDEALSFGPLDVSPIDMLGA